MTEPHAFDLTKVKVRVYTDGRARFYIEDETGQHRLADTYSPAVTALLRAALKENK